MNLIQDFINGGYAGLLSGLLVSPFEYKKVCLQMNQKYSIAKLTKNVPSFSLLFGMTCAIEFSINEQIKIKYGIYPGLICSALSGATFLTAADHVMFRLNKFESLKQAIAFRRLLTGYIPMFFREALWISSTIYFGPFIGGAVQITNNKQINEGFGRLISGIITNLLSQPFDCLSRQAQELAYKGQYTNIINTIIVLHKNYEGGFNHPFFKGLTPRLFLATFGSILAGQIFNYHKII